MYWITNYTRLIVDTNSFRFAVAIQTGIIDVLTALGVNVSALVKVSEDCLNEIGICFMFAPLYHGATAREQIQTFGAIQIAMPATAPSAGASIGRSPMP